MGEFVVLALLLLRNQPEGTQSVPSGRTVVRDVRGMCQIAVPADWTLLEGAGGAAVLRDASTAIAAVTSQPGQEFRPLTESMLRLLGIPKARLFENSSKRIYYQDKISRHAEDTNGFIASIPAGNGTCSCRVSAVPSVPVGVAKEIALSLAPTARDMHRETELRTSRSE